MGWNLCNYSLFYLGEFLFCKRNAESSVGNGRKIRDRTYMYLIVSGLSADPEYGNWNVLVCRCNALYDAACSGIDFDSVGISI